MRRCSLLLGLQLMVFAWVYTAFLSNAHATPHYIDSAPFDAAFVTNDAALLVAKNDVEPTAASSKGAASKAAGHPRATEIRFGQPVQPRSRRPTPPRDAPPKPPTPRDTGVVAGDTEAARDALEYFHTKNVELSLRTGEYLTGTVDFFTDDAVLIITRDGSLYIVELRDIQTIDPARTEEEPALAVTDDDLEQLLRQQQRDRRARIRDYRLIEAHQHIGRPMRIIGGTLLGLGAIAEVWGMTVLTTSTPGPREADDPFGNSLGKPAAIAGAPLIVGGISLIIGANVKRNRAIRKAKETNITYSVRPKFTRDGMGVEGVVRF